MNKKLIKMTLTAMFTAMIFIMTRFVAFPIASGYIHLGDVLVYIIASLIGGPYALFSAAVGEALADVTAGWAIYAPATLIVKTLVAIPFCLCYKKSERIITPLTALLTVPSGVITVLGYFVTDLIIDKAYAVTDLAGNTIQAAASAVIFIALGAALDSAKLKKNLFMNRL